MLCTVPLRAICTLVVLLWVAAVSSASAQSALEVTTPLEGLAPPDRILAMQPGSRTYLSERKGGWGRLDVPPGRYEVLLFPRGRDAVPVRFPAVAVGAGETVEVAIDSAIALDADSDVPRLARWLVTDPSEENVQAQVFDRYGLTPMPPGRYRVLAPVPGEMARSGIVSVERGGVTRVPLSDLGIGHVSLGMPPRDLRFLFGGDEVRPVLEIGGERFDIGPERRGDRIDLWLHAGPVALERAAGSLVERRELDIAAGTSTAWPFDLDNLLRMRGLSAFALPDGGGTQPPSMTIVAPAGDSALLFDPAPRAGVTFVAPGGAEVTLHDGEGGGTTIALQAGTVAELPDPAETGSARRPVTIALETPGPAAEYPQATQAVEVVGRASAAAEAGPTRIVLAVDVSGSTAEGAGADLDGDGRTDTILDAERAALHALIDGLAAREDAAPGSAFELALVAFGETAAANVPLQPLSAPDTGPRLRAAVEALAPGAQGGNTFYDRALDAALRQFAAHPGPGPEVVLLVTDGKPSQVVPSVDAAARLGRAGVILHTVGLGSDFTGTPPSLVSYPPVPEDGASILAAMARFGAGDGRVWALPRPAEIVDIVPALPVLEETDAGIAELRVINETLGQSAAEVDLRPDGAFRATVPVAFGTEGVGFANILRVVARSVDGGEAVETRRVLSAGAPPPEPEIPPEALAALRDEAALARRAAERAAAERDAARRQVAALTAERDEARNAAAAAEAGRAEAEAVRAARAAAGAELAERIAELERSEAGLRDRLAAQDGALAEARATLAAAQADAATTEARRAALQEARSTCETARTTCEADLISALERLLSPVPAPDGLVLSVPGDVLFDFGKTEVRPDAAEALRLATLYIADHAKADLVVEGHTDGVGSAETNMALSGARAQAVADWLISQAGIAPDRLKVRPFGETRPVSKETLPDGSDWPEGRQRNRRVEIRILK